jgi:hypothetical protein
MIALLTHWHETAADHAVAIVAEADRSLSDEPERSLELYRNAYALLIKSGGIGNKRMAENIRMKKVIPLAVRVFAK